MMAGWIAHGLIQTNGYNNTLSLPCVSAGRMAFDSTLNTKVDPRKGTKTTTVKPKTISKSEQEKENAVI